LVSAWCWSSDHFGDINENVAIRYTLFTLRPFVDKAIRNNLQGVTRRYTFWARRPDTAVQRVIGQANRFGV
jgi:hypothetical protein